ncbi:phenylacetate--CoA ligase family protein [Actinokineospora spheciospongiae]|uniref:phenylacetate--CoA ligase family protein n=1 Tax=Actinokineospora spheciospongiae TaxID=909613 RepID=UPI000D70E9E1|nr:AMP-binding protein [Actinokineospora spheciospongiae]PWW55546.1 phenylacetate-CoA ligase [Actinokineospora spheciospongiae]
MTHLETTRADALPRLGQWTGGGGLRRVQEDRLPEALRLASRNRANLDRIGQAGVVRTVEDLGRVPVIDKRDLRLNYPLGLLAVDRGELSTYHESSGTSGTPTSSFFTEGDWLDVVDRFVRNTIDLTPLDTLLVRTPYAMLTTGHQAHLAGRYRGATVVPADNRSAVVTHARVVQLLRDLEVTVAWCLPTEALLWAVSAKAAGLRPERDFPRLRGFLVAGEPLSDARRQRISRTWGGVPVLQDYGSTETGSLAGECSAGRLHLWADRFVPQVYDSATGHSAMTGTGELVITTLYREAMPLLRYNLQDLVRISDPDCSCGWSLPTIEILGRNASSCLVSGEHVTQQRIEDAVFALPDQHEVLFWRARGGEFLEVEFETATVGAQMAAAELTALIRNRVGVEARVRPVPVGTIVPWAALTRLPEFLKPRTLFDEGEDWDRAVSYW